MSKLRIVVIDNSRLLRRLVTDACRVEPSFEIVEAFENGQPAIQKLASLRADVVLLDIEMLFMEGLATLKGIRKQFPKLPVIAFSSATELGQVLLRDAVSLGLTDHISKPTGITSGSNSGPSLAEQLQSKLKPLLGAAGKLELKPRQPAASPLGASPGGPSATSSTTASATTAVSPSTMPSVSTAAARLSARRLPAAEVLVIASSTGGPNALVEFFKKIPGNFPIPIVIAQHMPANFTPSFARQLNSVSPLTVREAQAGAALAAGDVWLAPGDFHVEIHGTRLKPRLHLHQGPQENSVRPAADILFRTAAEVFRGGVLALVLTGMGKDGQAGCEVVRAQGGRVVVQDEATSVVWGMPGAVVAAGLADWVLPLDRLAEEITALAGTPLPGTPEPTAPLATAGLPPRSATPGPLMSSWMANS